MLPWELGKVCQRNEWRESGFSLTHPLQTHYLKQFLKACIFSFVTNWNVINLMQVRINDIIIKH